MHVLVPLQLHRALCSFFFFEFLFVSIKSYEYWNVLLAYTVHRAKDFFFILLLINKVMSRVSFSYLGPVHIID